MQIQQEISKERNKNFEAEMKIKANEDIAKKKKIPILILKKYHLMMQTPLK